MELGSVPQAGLYAWWDLSGSLTPFYPATFPQVDTSMPLYVGIAKTGIDERGVGMHLESTRVSTVRRTLVALLQDHLELLPGVTVNGKGKFSLAVQYEQRLTAWMLENLRVTWATHEWPETVERQIIQDLLPPFNDIHAHAGDYWRHMRSLRSDLCRAAALML